VSMKRLNYFTHQLLREQDFKAEQAYQIAMRRRHNRLFHSWGVAEGLDVQKKDDRSIIINPGTAIDNEGKEIVLESSVVRDLSTFNRNSETYVTIGYHESWDEEDHQTTGGVEGYSRVTEVPEILERRHQPRNDVSVVTLARVQLNELGHVHYIDMGSSVRKLAATSPAAGWLRMPFKPIPLNPVRIGKKLVRVISQEQAEEYEFVVDNPFGPASRVTEFNPLGKVPVLVTDDGATMETAARQFWPAVGQNAREMWTYPGGWSLYFDGDRLVDITVTGKPPL